MPLQINRASLVHRGRMEPCFDACSFIEWLRIAAKILMPIHWRPKPTKNFLHIGGCNRADVEDCGSPPLNRTRTSLRVNPILISAQHFTSKAIIFHDGSRLISSSQVYENESIPVQPDIIKIADTVFIAVVKCVFLDCYLRHPPNENF